MVAAITLLFTFDQALVASTQTAKLCTNWYAYYRESNTTYCFLRSLVLTRAIILCAVSSMAVPLLYTAMDITGLQCTADAIH